MEAHRDATAVAAHAVGARARPPWLLAALCAVATSLAPLGGGVGAQSPAGVWNVRSQDQTDRATGGVRVVLLRVADEGGQLHAEITSIRNTFMPVEEFRYERGTMHVVFGSHEYTLRIDGDRLTGTVVSPLGTQPVEGVRQRQTLMYVGDEPDPFRTTRTGTLGHRTLLDPPAGEGDPAAWVRSRIGSVEDLALVVGRRAKVAVGFTNARDFEGGLLALAGQPVTIVGTWAGERLQIESVTAATP
jgi:hypothetical protein